MKYILFIASLFLASFTFSQDTNFGEVLDAYTSNDKEDIYKALKKIDTTRIPEYDKATWLYYYADYNFYSDNHDIAYQSSLSAKKKFLELGENADVKDCNIQLLSIISHQSKLDFDRGQLITELEEYANKNKDTTAMLTVYYELASDFFDIDQGDKAIEYYNKIRSLELLLKDTLRAAYADMNIGTVHSVVLKNNDSALYYSKKAIPILLKNKDYRNLAYNYNNQAQQYKALSNYPEAIKYYKKSDSIPLDKFEAKSKVIFYENMAEVYKLNKDYENSSKYYERVLKLKDTINDVQQNTNISETEEKYQNEKLRADNLEIEANRIQNRNIAIGFGGSLALGSVIVILVYNNRKRKQQLKTQQLTSQLKEEELKSINALVEGQEKERLAIANDLHDDLGSLMATIKLHFGSFKDTKTSQDLFTKTNTLIDEAYQKIRNIAHAKNSGVLAKQGLYEAIKKHANSISNSEMLKVNVIENGLTERLENSVELTIFRIVQELITNVLKHAQATEVDIHLNQYDNTLNIMVEDNGIGFDVAKVQRKDTGIGLTSIERRIEKLDGTMMVESKSRNGTSVIINIPL